MNLTTDAIVSLISTGITLLSMALTIWLALGVRSIRDQIAIDIRRVNLTHASRSLEKSLADIRKLQDSTSAISRGRGRASLLDAVQAQFDVALMQIDVEGPDSDVRFNISNAQKKLHLLRKEEEDLTACGVHISEMQSLVQDAVSQLNGRSLRLEGKSQ